MPSPAIPSPVEVCRAAASSASRALDGSASSARASTIPQRRTAVATTERHPAPQDRRPRGPVGAATLRAGANALRNEPYDRPPPSKISAQRRPRVAKCANPARREFDPAVQNATAFSKCEVGVIENCLAFQRLVRSRATGRRTTDQGTFCLSKVYKRLQEHPGGECRPPLARGPRRATKTRVRVQPALPEPGKIPARSRKERRRWSCPTGRATLRRLTNTGRPHTMDA
jgi:hypothetical protein